MSSESFGPKATSPSVADSVRLRGRHSRSIGAESEAASDGLQSPTPSITYGWSGHSGGGMGIHGSGPQYKCVSRRSSVVSTSSSFFDRSFFSTPESRIVDHGKKTTLSYATLMLNLYNNISLDLKSAVDANRRMVVQTVASRNKAAQLDPDLGRIHADITDAIDTLRTINQTKEFSSIKDLLCHSLQVYEDIKRNKHPHP
ncbi:hypothetical protein GGI25_000666 [Coemansia spiralis]|uniref:Uncharacterized protein n=2 Tax=Coemansia TaxID=4863 RepID=A0A9W8GBQ9_9FUNG|nr:hypothetical protein BX070DRAFT_233795 [Coemansia spiralis]KAJ1995687.1 hypothetical protein EDC05_000621 [Coemansia umbellata]KAJ2623708.1 hypothetical protein GGI26_002155 [Coemansia sp. RSA 1358]KAJ2680374.1 hypothetical protein GGI25_000666 [Coemansia spiralis]